MDKGIPLAGIIEESIVDGYGLRFVLFTQGCPHHCPGCQNPETHPLTGGTLYSIPMLLDAYKKNPLLTGMTFSGGEPFLHAPQLVVLAEAVHSLGGSIVTYTGYVFETLYEQSRKDNDYARLNLLEQSDILIDGPYIEAERDLTLLFRGSRNQRILDKTMRSQLLTKSCHALASS